MIVSESDILTAALDERLQVGGILALGPVGGMSSTSGGARAATAGSGTPTLADHLPLGQLVSARVVEVPDGQHVIAEFGRLRFALAWPGGSAAAPAAGTRIALRVLAHEPMLLFESVAADGEPRGTPDAPTRLSVDARTLQAPPGTAGGPIRFTVPMLQIEIVPLTAAPPGSDDVAAPNGHDDRIPLDEVIVAQEIVLEQAAQAPRDATLVLPLLLQGPAWPGQDVELVVRRERRDEAFENPALDQWCGELVIDLPTLGRVSGHLAWSMQGLRIRLEGQDETSVAQMNATTAELARALAEVDLPVLSVSVGRPQADTRQPGTVDRG